MAEYVEVRTEDGDLVPFEIDEEHDGPVRVGRRWDRTKELAEDTLEGGVELARSVAGTVARRIGSLRSPAPDRVAVEIGLKVGASGLFAIARSTAEAHVKITVEWQRESLATVEAKRDEDEEEPGDGD